MAMQFVAASSQYLQVASEFSTLRATFSLSFWIKTTQVGSNTPWLAPGVTGIEQAGGNDDIMIGIIGADGKIGIDIGNPGDFFQKSTTTINDDVWHHVVITRSQSPSEVKIYVDGNLESTDTGRTGGTIGNTFTSIGAVQTTGPGAGPWNYLDGQLDDLRVYSRVLSLEEIKSIFYARGSGDGIVYGIVHRYVFNERKDGLYVPNGQVRRDVWTDILGTAVSDLTGLATFPGAANFSDFWTSFEGPTDVLNHYGAKMYGWFIPNFTGNHYFAIASDDNGQLNLSTDWNPANKVQIAYVSPWCASRAYNTNAGQISGPIALVSGVRYYIEALMKEMEGGDNLAVAVNNSGVFVNGDAPIAAAQLSEYLPVMDIEGLRHAVPYNGPTWRNSPLLHRRDAS